MASMGDLPNSHMGPSQEGRDGDEELRLLAAVQEIFAVGLTTSVSHVPTRDNSCVAVLPLRTPYMAGR